ncbi:hypothetical protein V6N11_061259 [Hibiscus sabdariffa]|uniref:glucan endo-1,3-beta-D-glucosidase n=1 Tax=Hibiscus sabdariffa TaxID=183260 RepID=A0ABR2NVD7_9ROSI
MCSRLKLVFAVSVLLQLLDFSRGNNVGVAYGRDANNLPSPDKVAQLVRNHNIQYIRIYDTDPQVLNAFKNTGIAFTVGVHNSDLPAFQSQSYVDSWLTNSILPFYQATRITHITVGNEVTESPDNAANLVVPAMRNVVSALKKSNLQDSIKVSTPLSFGVLSNSFPPSEGAFKSSLAYVLNPLLEFLDENQSPFMVNIYPYFAINDDSSLKFALFEPSNQVFVDWNTGLRYDNMFDAQLDAVHFAIANQFRKARNLLDAQLDDVRFSLAYQNLNEMKIVVIETGYPKGGSPGHRFATIDNARIYNTNLIRHVTSGSGTTAMPGGVHVMSGTPAKPNAEVDVYIFSLFDENLKQGSDIEGHWGIFYPDMTPAYDLEFPGTPSGKSWCIASSQASKSALQNALDWACGPGKADCSDIQPGGQCFEPDNLVSHASFAFNNYYQKHGLTDEACSFGGTGIKVYNDPSYGNCIYHYFSRGNNVGVAYGRDGNNLPSPDKVAQLVQNHNIQYIRIYDTDPQVLNAFKNTDIEFTVGVHNSDLPAFQSQSYVDSWLTNSILPFYQATRITHITVGNEVTESSDNAANLVVPAMRNVVSALKKSNLQDSIKVSTPLSFGVLSNSFPPSIGAFNSSLAYVLNPLLEFLDENRSPFMVNLYPYSAIKDDSSLKFALFEPSDQVFVDQNSGLRYDNMFDAQLDAVHFAIFNQLRKTRNVLDAQLDVVRFSLTDQSSISDMKTIVTETGYPKGGSTSHGFVTIDNARIYNTNLIRHVTSGSPTTSMPAGVHLMSGTPAKPNGEVNVYIFSLFDENLKQGSDLEGHWGIFYPDMTPAYNLEFPGKGTDPSGRSWCIASSQASKSALQNALDWACGPGKTDCSAIQPDGQCFVPDNLVSHASFAFNNYYQKHGLTDEACSFGGTGIKVYSDPSYGNCIYNVKSNDPNGRTCLTSNVFSQILYSLTPPSHSTIITRKMGLLMFPAVSTEMPSKLTRILAMVIASITD